MFKKPHQIQGNVVNGIRVGKNHHCMAANESAMGLKLSIVERGLRKGSRENTP